jgi:hypothetical protein
MNRRALAITIIAALVGLGSWSGGASCAAADQAQANDRYSAAALYNLGNAYARSNNAALAVLSYERARVLAPTDPDIRANLRHVRETAGLPVQSENWMNQWGRFANPDTMYWLGLFGIGLAGTSFLRRRPDSQHRTALAATGILGLLLTTLSLWDCAATAPTLSESVVMQTAAATASPVSGTDPLFTLPAAAVVHVHDEHQGFVLIRDSQGREGWVARSKLTAVIPGRETSVGTTT